MTKIISEDIFIVKKRNLKNDYYSLVLKPFSKIENCQPGQFVHLRIPSASIFFRRAFSLADTNAEKGTIEIIFKVFGRGTRILSSFRKSDYLNVLGPLGVPFKLPDKKEKVLIAAGGIGLPPLLYLVAEMVKKGYNPETIEFFYGGKTAADIIERNRIKKMKVNFHPVTEDGSFGEKGLITTPMEEMILENKAEKMKIYSCGPEGMLKAVNELGLKYGIEGQISLEAPMPCGIGLCLGCVVPLVKGGHARVCCDGPVFDIGEVVL
ncbi:MAG: dihydroorotate dehydrogenase electron transfer subunit [FCB group bacterium]|nr:dihydroorotate dehydrogenase electron transfer subunit [FCB group bacterium]